MLNYIRNKWNSFYHSLAYPISLFVILLIVLFGLLFVALETPVSQDYVNDCKDHIKKLEFEGHTYLLFIYGYKGGLCHDENCHCKKGN